MRAIQALEQVGCIVSLDGDQILIKRPVNLDPETVAGCYQEIRDRREEAIAFLQAHSGQYAEETLEAFYSDALLRYPGEVIRCNYRGMERFVHPEPCKWHKLERKDPLCKACDPRSLVVRRDIYPGYFDEQMSEAVRKLDEAGVKIMDASPEDRRKTFQIEATITETANKGDVGGFNAALKEWVKIFLAYRRH